ncbi:MAG: hypothetical protein IT269_08085 [Saprospiraceae bacterium]|nr:hypothetical protein [Saprospiraceae bacterium]
MLIFSSCNVSKTEQEKSKNDVDFIIAELSPSEIESITSKDCPAYPNMVIRRLTIKNNVYDKIGFFISKKCNGTVPYIGYDATTYIVGDSLVSQDFSCFQSGHNTFINKGDSISLFLSSRVWHPHEKRIFSTYAIFDSLNPYIGKDFKFVDSLSVLK